MYMKALMLKNVYEGLNARSEVYLSKKYFCKMYPTCMSSKLCDCDLRLRFAILILAAQSLLISDELQCRPLSVAPEIQTNFLSKLFWNLPQSLRLPQQRT